MGLLTVTAATPEVEGDGLAHLVFGVLDGVFERDAAGQIRRPGAIAAVLGTFDDDQVARCIGVGHRVAPSVRVPSLSRQGDR
jgi:hypothetical protein